MIVGGVFGRDEEYRRSINPTPEMTLVAGLAGRGVDVVAAPHAWRTPLEGIDLVHVHHLAKAVPVMGALRAAGKAPRLVFTRHNEEFTLPWRRRAALQVVNTTADAFVALSHQEAARLRREVHGPVVVIRNGIAPPERIRVRSEDDTGPWRLLFAGQLIPRKGVDVLLRAVARIRHRREASLRLVFHNAYQLAELRELARTLDIADVVAFVGSQDPRGMALEYETADVVVLPSLAEAESLPSVITESLLAHKPVVASADAGIPEQVQQAGILVCPGDVADLAGALLDITAGYGTYQRAAANRSQELHPEYDIDTMIDRHLRLYRSLVEGRPVDVGLRPTTLALAP
jgi:glycosyltransferase involved in cell wall biosynthesis